MFLVKHTTVNNTNHYKEFTNKEDAYEYAATLLPHFAIAQVCIYNKVDNNYILSTRWYLK